MLRSTIYKVLRRGPSVGIIKGPQILFSRNFYKSCSLNITWQDTKIMSSSSHFFSPSDFDWLNLLVLEAQGTRLLRSLDRLVSMRRLCRMLWGCLKDRKQRLLTARPLPPLPTRPPLPQLHRCDEEGHTTAPTLPHILPSGEDVTGIVRAGTINQHVIDSGVYFLVFFLNLIQAQVIWEDDPSVEKMSPSGWPRESW